MIRKIPTLNFLSNLTLVLLVLALTSFAVEPAKDQEIIARITANIFVKDHYRQHLLDDEISEQLFYEYFKTLDPSRLYLTQEDIKRFEKYKLELDDMLLNGDVTFAFEVYDHLLKRAEDCRRYSEEVIKGKLDFTVDENYMVDRSKEKWPAGLDEQKELWRLKIKNDILYFRLMERAEKEKAEEAKDKAGSTKPEKEPVEKWNRGTPEERMLKRLSNNIRYLKDNDSSDILEQYLTAFANVYDPHSVYMSQRTVEDFNIQMKLSLVGIGATLSMEDGYTKIINIIQGGPADIDGRLKPDDRIIAVAQDEAEPVDVVDMPLSKVVNLIRGKKDTVVRLTILKGEKGIHAIPELISLTRDTVKLTEQEAKGEIKKMKMPDGSEKKIGVLVLPSFYFDFEGATHGNNDFKSSTNDVRKIITGFKKDKVDGILLDMRSNGGGSLFEAITLTGLFIKKGPVVQVKNPNGSVDVKNDPDKGIFYDGPLAVMVNRLSASAAEIFAGAIKDYGRGILIGDSHTHGKGTVQTIYDLDNFLRHYGLKSSAGAIRITTSKFYRINGESTQNKGIKPDIAFPSYTDCMDIGEEFLEHSLPWDTITPVKYEAYSDMQKCIPALEAKSIERRKNEVGFKILSSNIERFRKIKEQKSVTLNEQKRWELYKEEKKLSEQQWALMRIDNPMDEDVVEENAVKKKDGEKIATEEGIKIDGKYKKDKKPANDLFLDESAKILCDFIGLAPPEDTAALAK
ncbi:MAG TPA: tail-specific protease [Lentisphaeria bacterium]|nr:MAG: hypothetical protein A2X48_20250 [Lentisphaerae bacterium GWF2_49_21]HBC86201.1 tail-specific protease [Lentisphaeria bacterium]